MTTTDHVDVLIIGAGLSGVGAACRLKSELPGTSVAILEGREASGGTWDLFRYPGIRSDSDMFTFAFPWRPWDSDIALADGPMILDYIRSAAEEYDVDSLIRYRHRVLGASWDSGTSRWTVRVSVDGVEQEITAGFLWGATGYYDYDEAFAPQFPGEETFGGQVVHPQFWPEDLDYTGKKIVVIGSGATAITLVPSLAETAGHVTMLQRSPTYIVSLPRRDKLAARLQKWLPTQVSAPLIRWNHILVTQGSYALFRARPEFAKKLIRERTERQLPDLDTDKHFRPSYNPWEQRLCAIPDSDLFKVLRKGTASVVTETIETFDETGIQLTSGEHLDADIIVTATGLKVLAFGGITFEVDGEKVDVSQTMTYRAMMLSGIPNFAYTMGYTNASWTLKADLINDYVIRLLTHLNAEGLRSVVPVRDDSVVEKPFMDFSSGYVLRALDAMPKQGDRAPWMLKQNYVSDLRTIRTAPLDDGVLEFA